MTTPATYTLCTCRRCGAVVPRARMATSCTTTGKPRGECRECWNAAAREYYQRTRPVRERPAPPPPPVLVACACGCGAVFPERSRWHHPRRFVCGHNMRVAGKGARP